MIESNRGMKMKKRPRVLPGGAWSIVGSTPENEQLHLLSIAVSCRGLVQLAQGLLTAELHAVLLVDSDHLDAHFVTDFANVRNAVDVIVGQLADVAQPVLAGNDLDERAKVLDAGHPTVID